MDQSDLLAPFFAHLGDSPIVYGEERGLAALLGARWHEALVTWPGIAVDQEAFMAYLARRVPAHEDLTRFLDRAFVPDLYLCCGCLQGDPTAIEQFENHVWSDADLAVRCMDTDPHVAEEVKQELRCALLVGDAGHPARLSLYNGLGSLRSWLKVVAVRAVQQTLRAGRRRRIDEDKQLAFIADPDKDQELAYLKRLYHAEFSAAFRRAVTGLDDRQRNLLVLRHVEGLNIDQIGEIYGVHRATAARWVSAARQTLLEGTRQEMNRAMRLKGSEVDSIIWLIESQMPMIVRENLVPEDDTTLPARRPFVPEDDTTLPARRPFAPEDDTTLPARRPFVPEDDTTLPARRPFVPEDDTTLPARRPFVPEDDTTLPARRPFVPEEVEDG